MEKGRELGRRGMTKYCMRCRAPSPWLAHQESTFDTVLSHINSYLLGYAILLGTNHYVKRVKQGVTPMTKLLAGARRERASNVRPGCHNSAGPSIS